MNKPYQIASQQSFFSYFVSLLVAVVAILIGLSIYSGYTDTHGKEYGRILSAIGVIALLVLVVLVVKYSIRGKQIKQRKRRLAELHVAGGMKQHTGLFAHSSLNGLDEGKIVRNRRFENFVDLGSYTYADYAHDIYVRSRYGEHHTTTHYYAVIAARLPRKLPHVLFDSLRSRKRQFRFMFAGNQLHNLEGDFNRHFAVYFPYEYHIDSLSFLAPDVLWAMRDAAEYDIEIIGDNIYMFGAQASPDEQLKDMHDKLDAIIKALGKSLETYRDERLPYATGRSSVAPLGVMLARNLTLEYLKLFIGVSGVVVTIALIAVTRIFNNSFFYFLIISAAAAYSAWRTIYREKIRQGQVQLQMETLQKSRALAEQKHT